MISVQDLNEIRDKMKNEMRVRENGPEVTHVLVGMGTCGIAAGAKDILYAFIDEILDQNIEHATVTQMGCIGLCKYEPIVEIKEPDGKKFTYINVTKERVHEIVKKHLAEGSPIIEYTLGYEE